MPRYPYAGLPNAHVAELEWLTGRWLAEVDGAVIEETWSDYRGGMLLGTFRWSVGEEVRFYEIQTLESDGKYVHLRVRHFDKGLIAWEDKEDPHELVLVELNEERAVFFEQDMSDPRWAVYDRTSRTSLRVYFTHDEVPDSKPGVFEFFQTNSAF